MTMVCNWICPNFHVDSIGILMFLIMNARLIWLKSAAQFLYDVLERSLNKPTCYGDYHA